MDNVETDFTLAAARSTERTRPFDVDLGSRLQVARTAAGMSLTALGGRIGVSSQHVQKYEIGKDRVSASTLFRFAVAFGVPGGSLFEHCPRHRSTAMARSGRGDELSVKIALPLQEIVDARIHKELVALAAALGSTSSAERAP